MSADEQVAQQPQLTPSMAAKLPHSVYNQLSNDFLPAAKDVGHAGIVLLKAYQSVQEALTLYCSATHRLIKSADSAGGKSRAEATELSKVFKKFVEGVTAHQKVIAEFETLATKVSSYSSQDKEKMKQEYSEFKKSEKKILKNKSSSNAQEFYKKSAADWLRQQELRYKFFNEKIGRWIHSYVEMAQSLDLVTVPARTEEVKNVTAAPEVVEHVDWHEHLHNEAEKLETETNISPPVVHHIEKSINENKPDDVHSLSSDSSQATTLDSLPSRRQTNENVGVTLVHHEKRKSIEITSPISVAPRPEYRPAPQAAPREEYNSYPTHVNGNSGYDRHVPEAPSNHAPGGGVRSGRNIPGAVPVFGLVGNEETRYVPQRNNNTYQVVTKHQIPVGRVVEKPITAEQMNQKRYHVDSDYVAGAAPSHQPHKPMLPPRHDEEEISVPSFFNPSQYGSILIVNDDFNASSGAQMTVNRGDKVILLKCGARGWVFVRDSISNRTGWIPEPYVNP